MPTWFLELAGDRFDLDRLADAFQAGDLSLEEQDGRWQLRYQPYQRIEDAVSAEAEHHRLLVRVNALASVEWGDDYEPVSAAGFGAVEPDGSIHRYLHGTAHGRARASGTVVITGHDGEPLPPPASPLPGRLSLAAENPNVDDALHFLQRKDPTWGELYKVLEIVEADSGAINEQGLASKAERTRFTRSANHQDVAGRDARHARMNVEPPPNPMTLPEARTLIRRVVRSWLSPRVAT